jgi:HD superfamily phosphodiesterase
MVKLDAIRKQAQQDLVLTCPEGRRHTMLWDHSSRVCDSALLIASLPEFAREEIDPNRLTVVAFYHDAGWAVQYESGDIDISAVLGTLTTPIQSTLAASFMLDRLKKLASPQILESAAECIRVLCDHDITQPCAQIVAEADHLDEFSVVTSCSKVFKQMHNGRSVDAVLDTWDNQNSYGFWTAKIKDSFRFESTRQIANARLKVLEQFIEHMRMHHKNMDVRKFLDSDGD